MYQGPTLDGASLGPGPTCSLQGQPVQGQPVYRADLDGADLDGVRPIIGADLYGASLHTGPTWTGPTWTGRPHPGLGGLRIDGMPVRAGNPHPRHREVEAEIRLLAR